MKSFVFSNLNGVGPLTLQLPPSYGPGHSLNWVNGMQEKNIRVCIKLACSQGDVLMVHVYKYPGKWDVY